MDLLLALPDFVNSAPAPADLLAGTTGSSGADEFLDTSLGKTIQALAGALGLLVALIGVFKAIGSFISGKIGAGIKVIVGTIFIAGILFNLGFLIDFASWLSDIVGNALSSAEETGNSGNS